MREEVEVVKVEIPKRLAERLRRYAAEKYGLRRGALSKAVEELLEKSLGPPKGSESVEGIVGLGLLSNYTWEGEDLVEALRRRHGLRDRR
ncbi:MAG: hypothetical protein QXI84_09655 [Thermofilaceae archaeon]